MGIFRKVCVAIMCVTMTISSEGQGFMSTKGDSIIDAGGENFLIRSLGTGNWMIMEGYMMEAYVNGGTHTGFRNRLIEDIGVANTDSFYTTWLHNHFNEADVDSMANWGFNTVRPALHYLWFTLPIEEEPVKGEQTWLDTGFELLDSLVKWCAKHELYIILDMHGAPGGQGADRAISDYNPPLPSLWESEDNKTKLVELWGKIAERYKDEPWIIGYDLINEPNWNLPGGTALRQLYGRITDKIREVDQNHILFIEGNWFANDFTGLTPPWDDNMAYSFHKYWTVNSPGSLGYGTWLRDTYNVPVWIGETGENSNVWFASLVEECERENVGWSFWPVKKGSNSNVMRAVFNDEYRQLVSSWYGESPAPSPEEAFQAVLTLSERHRAENCSVQYDVIDAIMRQPFTNDLKPFRIFEPTENIYATDYAYGRHGFAYVDQDTGNYSGQPAGGWNQGGKYRNDGVDIQEIEDTEESNGYNLGWVNKGEWLVYHLQLDSAVLVDATIRSASGASSGGSLLFEVDGRVISYPFDLPETGGWQNWTSTTYEDILLPAGLIELKMIFTEESSNISYFTFQNPRPPGELTFKMLYAETSIQENQIFLHLNKDITSGSISTGDFILISGNSEIAIREVIFESGSNIIILVPEEVLPYTRNFYVSYNGTDLMAGAEGLPSFSDIKIDNKLQKFPTLPSLLQAEDFLVNSGFELEVCQDAGGGLNTSYSNPGDYLDYIINVEEDASYQLDFRVALGAGNSTIQMQYEDEDHVFVTLAVKTFTSTGGWQTWETQSLQLDLPKGKYRFRIKCLSGEHNINWFEFKQATGLTLSEEMKIAVYPNPASDHITVEIPGELADNTFISLFDASGRMLLHQQLENSRSMLPVQDIAAGLYFLKISNTKFTESLKLIVE